MRIFKVFGKDLPANDPYREFDEKRHFRPQINKGDFFKLSGYEFGRLVLKPIWEFVEGKENEIERVRFLSFGQKALYFWWIVDAEVTNGGFVQFYYNGCGPYAPTLIKSLEYIGDKQMAGLIRQADNVYQKNKRLMEKARGKDLFGSDLYDRLEEMSPLDDEYDEVHRKTLAKIEKYIRRNPNEFCLDEEGNEFNMEFSGECRSFYPENKIKDVFQLENGKIEGEFKTYYQNGNPKEEIQFLKGEPTGERLEYYENGSKKYTVEKINAQNQFEHYWFYENGLPKKVEHKLLDKDETIGEYKEWYDNGQLAATGTYISKYDREGQWLEFYKDGGKKLEAEFKNREFLIQNCWNEKGDQTLKDGAGVYNKDYTEWTGYFSRTEEEYKNYKKHGQQKTFRNGILSLYQEMENGKEHGITRTYYNNGKIKNECLYQHGAQVSGKNFRKFENPKVEFKIHSRVFKEGYGGKETIKPPENEPKLLNQVELESALKADKSIFKPYDEDYIMCYTYIVRTDKEGRVKEIRFASADNLWLEEDVEKSIKKLQYEVALSNGQPTECLFVVQYKISLTE